jgi:hypothetical protein
MRCARLDSPASGSAFYSRQAYAEARSTQANQKPNLTGDTGNALAGRCVSATREALGAIRPTAPALAMG